MPTIALKRGEDLVMDCAVAGDLTGWTVRAQVRNKSDVLLADMDVSPLTYDSDAEVTRYTLSASRAVTSVWPVADAEMDVEYTDPEGLVAITETVAVSVRRNITRGVVA